MDQGLLKVLPNVSLSNIKRFKISDNDIGYKKNQLTDPRGIPSQS